MSRIVECPGCHAKNRLPAAPRARCGKCKREFTPWEVLHAAVGERAGQEPTQTDRQGGIFADDDEDDADGDGEDDDEDD